MADTKLTTRQRVFVQTYVKMGGRNATAAAISAGYGQAGAHVTGHRLLQRDYILEAIKKETERCLRAGVAVAYDTLQDLAQHAESESVRLNASLAMLDRGGLQLAQRTEHHHVIEDKRSDGELLARIEKLQRDLGLKTIPGEVVELKALPRIPGQTLPPVEIVPEEAEAVTNPVTSRDEEDIFR